MRRWLSGLRRTIGNRVRSKASGGSNPLLRAKIRVGSFCYPPLFWYECCNRRGFEGGRRERERAVCAWTSKARSKIRKLKGGHPPFTGASPLKGKILFSAPDSRNRKILLREFILYISYDLRPRGKPRGLNKSKRMKPCAGVIFRKLPLLPKRLRQCLPWS